VEHRGIENIPEKGPALLLPKHQSYWDILLEGDLLRKRGRFANLVMKGSLPSLFKYGGGIPIIRPKDVSKQKTHIPKNNREAKEYIEFLCERDEIIIIHPEGTRIKNGMGKIQGGLINHIKKIEENLGIKIPVIPIGIEYKDIRNIRSKVNVRVGKSLDLNTPDLDKIIGREIRSLSGLENVY